MAITPLVLSSAWGENCSATWRRPFASQSATANWPSASVSGELTYWVSTRDMVWTPLWSADAVAPRHGDADVRARGGRDERDGEAHEPEARRGPLVEARQAGLAGGGDVGGRGDLAVPGVLREP